MPLNSSFISQVLNEDSTPVSLQNTLAGHQAALHTWVRASARNLALGPQLRPRVVKSQNHRFQTGIYQNSCGKSWQTVPLCRPHVGSIYGHACHTQLQHPRARGRLKRGSYYSRETGHSFSSLKGAQTFVPFLVSWQKWENSPACQKLVGLPGA